MTIPLEEKKSLILKAEEQFAYKLAAEVLKRPKLSIWMILIPIIIVHHMFRHQKVMDGRKGFAENYLISRKRALTEAFLALTSAGKPDIEKIVRLSDLPEETMDKYTQWIDVLTAHYTDLLQADGTDYPSLTRSAYHNRSSYLLQLNRLNRVEQEFNTCLKAHLEEKPADVEEILSTMASASERLRREVAHIIFP